MITGSKVGLARACEGAFAVEQLEEKNEWQDGGNERHDERDDAIKRGDVPEVLTSRWPRYTWRSEVKFAIDVATGVGRELTAPGKRNYSEATPFDVCGTADVVGTKEGAPLIIGDWKSFDPNVPRAQVNAQLHIAALALGRAWGCSEAEVFIHHEVRPLDVAAIDEMDLDAFFAELRDIVQKAAAAKQRYRAGEPVKFTTGSHCRWCAGFNACPEQAKLVQLVKSEAADTQVELLMPLHDDVSAAAAYELSQRLGMLKKRLDAAIHARAAERPFLVKPGVMFGKVQARGNERIDGDVAYDVIRGLHGQHIADAAVERATSKKAIKEALSLKGARGQVAEMERVVLGEIRGRNGVTYKTTEKFEEYPAQQLKAGAQ